MRWILIGAWAVLLVLHTLADNPSSLEEAKEYLKYLDKETLAYSHRLTVAEWDYYSNATEENKRKRDEVRDSDNTTSKVFDWLSFNDTDVIRQAKFYGYLIPDEVWDRSSETYTQMEDVRGQMRDLFLAQTLCNYTNKEQCGISVFPSLFYIFSESNDPEEMKYYWIQHQDKITKDLKPLYPKYVALGNKYAQFFNYSNKAEQLLDQYESPPADKFEKVVLDLYEQFRPLYAQLHAYVRKRLYAYYGPCSVDRTGPIPIHLTGTLNAEVFTYIADKITPYPNKPSLDATPQIIKQNLTVEQLAGICDDFYQSLGLPAMPDTFWKYSIFEEPKDREVYRCGTSWDMRDKKDYRIMACATRDMASLLQMCQNMGQLQYNMGYKDQPFCYMGYVSFIGQSWADIAGLSLRTIGRQTKLGFIEKQSEVDHELVINQLFFTALEKLVALPESIIYDLWRWRYFRGEINEHNSNKEWWNLRLQYQGLAPPEPRPDDGLDVASKNLIINSEETIGFALSYIMVYQMQEALCEIAGKYNPSDPASPPLSQCDLYGSEGVGEAVKKMFAKGLSKPWPEAFKEVTKSGDMDARPILQYFQPLYDWLKADNERTGEVIGW